MTANARGGTSDNFGSIGKWITIAAGALCCAIGAITMLAWHLHLVSLLVVTPASTPMRYNAALAFLLLGIALVGSAHQYKKLLFGCSAFVGMLAVATALEYILGRSFGIDDLLFDQYSIGSWTLADRCERSACATAACCMQRRKNNYCRECAAFWSRSAVTCWHGLVCRRTTSVRR